MVVNKLKTLIEKYKLMNIIKLGVFLIILFLLARLLMPVISNNIICNASNVEGFQTLGYSHYGNQLSLQDPTNTPVYAGNTCTFKFDGVYRIESLNFKFNNKNNVSILANPISAFNPETVETIYIQYEDGNGNLRYIKSSVNSSPPNFYNSTNLATTINSDNSQTSMVSINDITDENNLAVYTSRIVISIGNSNSNKIDTYIDNCNIGYISKFAFWGSTREMLSRKDFESLSATLDLRTFATQSNTYDDSTTTDTYNFTTTTDFLLYGIALNYTIETISSSNKTPTTTNAQASTCSDTTNSPFKLSILYNNGIYNGNNFTINTRYIIRNDPLRIETNTATDYILFAQPIIANKLVISIPRVNTTNNSKNVLKLVCNRLQGYGSAPTTSNIADYQRTVNALLSSTIQGQSLDICPSVDDLVTKQNQAQQICDNLEYQDRVKSEKLRLERNKQYLLKLQQQQQQIDQLNQVIQTLDNKRNQRAQTADVARVLQYQQQKGVASTVRDLANQRLQSQDNNQLYLDVNINSQ
jgi:hypothetical protein